MAYIKKGNSPAAPASLANSLGKVAPNAKELEAAVLGALLMDKEAANIVCPFLREEDFYEERHQKIYGAILALHKQPYPIDLLTVTERIKKNGHLDLIGGAYYLAELTNRVASTANVENHARIVWEKSIQRRLIRDAQEVMNAAYENSTDTAELVMLIEKQTKRLLKKTQAGQKENCFIVETANKALADGLAEKPARRLFGDFIFEAEVTICFADSNIGKSILCMQIADGISKGQPIIAGMPNEAGAMRVGYIDFELKARQFARRYSDYSTGEIHEFNDNLLRIRVKRPKCKGSELVATYIAHLREIIQEHKIEMLMLDNLTAMVGDMTKGEDAQDVITSLQELAEEGVTILVISHPKKGVSKGEDLNKYGLQKDDMLGSSVLGHLTDAMFALGQNAAEHDVVYAKNLKDRNTAKSDAVAVFERSKEGAFLGFTFKEWSTESKQTKKMSEEDQERLKIEIKHLYYSEGVTNVAEITRRVNKDWEGVRSFAHGSISYWLKGIKEDELTRTPDILPPTLRSDSMPF